MGNIENIHGYFTDESFYNPTDKAYMEIREKVIDPASQTLYICHADCLEKAKELGERIQKEIGFKDLYITLMGPTIGSHCGPELRAYFFLGKDRRQK